MSDSLINKVCAFGSKQDLKIKGRDGVQWKLELEVSVGGREGWKEGNGQRRQEQVVEGQEDRAGENGKREVPAEGKPELPARPSAPRRPGPAGPAPLPILDQGQKPPAPPLPPAH